MVTLFGGNKEIELKFWTFPGGERNVKIVDPIEIERYRSFTVRVDFRKSDDLIDMLLLVNAVRNVNTWTNLRLCIPYFPAARQDRVMTEGEPFALQVMAHLINSCNFDEVEVWDPHSDVLAGMFPAGKLKVKTQWDLWADKIDELATGRGNCVLVSPDAGALKKIGKLAKKVNMRVIEAGKVRDVVTGEIISTKVDVSGVSDDETLIVVDDICDGGRTFIELAAAIRDGGFAGTLILCVTHGIFSKGLEALNCFDKIYTVNNMSNEF